MTTSSTVSAEGATLRISTRAVSLSVAPSSSVTVSVISTTPSSTAEKRGRLAVGSSSRPLGAQRYRLTVPSGSVDPRPVDAGTDGALVDRVRAAGIGPGPVVRLRCRRRPGCRRRLGVARGCRPGRGRAWTRTPGPGSAHRPGRPRSGPRRGRPCRRDHPSRPVNDTRPASGVSPSAPSPSWPDSLSPQHQACTRDHDAGVAGSGGCAGDPAGQVEDLHRRRADGDRPVADLSVTRRPPSTRPRRTPRHRCERSRRDVDDRIRGGAATWAGTARS